MHKSVFNSVSTFETKLFPRNIYMRRIDTQNKEYESSTGQK